MSGIAGPHWPYDPNASGLPLSRADFLDTLNPELRLELERVVIPTQHATSIGALRALTEHVSRDRESAA